MLKGESIGNSISHYDPLPKPPPFQEPTSFLKIAAQKLGRRGSNPTSCLYPLLRITTARYRSLHEGHHCFSASDIA